MISLLLKEPCFFGFIGAILSIFITLLDSLEIGTDSVSGIVQILTELCIALNKLSTNFDK